MNEFLFGIYPYIAVTVFLLGSLFRYDRDQYTWKAGSSQMLSSKGMRLGSNLFHIGIILLFFGHLVGLLVPESIYHHFMTAGQKQLIAMVAGGFFGTLCFIGMVILIHRRLTNPRVRATSSFSDIFILLLIFVQLILGMLTLPVSAQHMDGSSMVALANWAQHIVTFRSGAADFIINQALIFKLHIFLGLTMFLVFPFTRLIHVWSAPGKYLFRKGYQIVRKRG
ncbi:MAG: respiratory nitrate reductase subunit gamma [Proteobacteria bacterium]|nr:respiratory nitrate reductase subunit gamma [Pseudomonadota bacterium]